MRRAAGEMLDTRLVLGDEDIFTQGFNALVVRELRAAVVGLGGRREHFEKRGGIEQCVVVAIRSQARFAADHDDVGIGVETSGADVDAEFAAMRATRSAAQAGA